MFPFRSSAMLHGSQGVRLTVRFVRSTYQELTLARQQLQDDYDKLKREEADKSAKLKELMLVSRSPRRNLDKCEKEVANRQMLRKDDEFGDFILSPKREKLGFAYGAGLALEKASVDEEKSLSAIPKSPPRHACNLHPLQLHLLISVTMILLTHRYPQIVVLVWAYRLVSVISSWISSRVVMFVYDAFTLYLLRVVNVKRRSMI